jgi:hypothetical protein
VPDVGAVCAVSMRVRWHCSALAVAVAAAADSTAAWRVLRKTNARQAIECETDRRNALRLHHLNALCGGKCSKLH